MGAAWEVAWEVGAWAGCVEECEVTPAKSLSPTRRLIKPSYKWADINEEEEEEEERGPEEEEHRGGGVEERRVWI